MAKNSKKSPKIVKNTDKAKLENLEQPTGQEKAVSGSLEITGTPEHEPPKPENLEQPSGQEKAVSGSLEIAGISEYEPPKPENLEQPTGQEKAVSGSLEIAGTPEHEPSESGNLEQPSGQENAVSGSLDQNSKAKFFIADVFLTAGPRKNFSQFASEGDRDLGEDVAGFVVLKDKVVFWVLDGTSDSAILKLDGKEVFSSRLLAQSIALNIRKVCPSNISSKSLIQKAVDETLNDWRDRFEKLGTKRNEFAKNYSTETFDISTTIITGVFDINGNLDVSRVGDCKILCFNSTENLISSLSKNPSREFYSRQFARLVLHPHKLDISFSENYDKIETDELKGVESVFAFSDGLSTHTENYIKVTFSKLLHGKVLEQIQRIPQKTNDDKALVTIQIQSI